MFARQDPDGCGIPLHQGSGSTGSSCWPELSGWRDTARWLSRAQGSGLPPSEQPCGFSQLPLTCALSWHRSYCFLGWGTWLCRCCTSSCADMIFSVSRLAQI